MALSITVYALSPESLFLDVKVIKKFSLCEGSGDDCGFVENRKQTNKQGKQQKTEQGEKVINSNEIRWWYILLSIESGMTYSMNQERLRKIFASIPEAYLHQELSLIFSQDVITHSGGA